jgi:hypothetical protein
MNKTKRFEQWRNRQKQIDLANTLAMRTQYREGDVSYQNALKTVEEDNSPMSVSVWRMAAMCVQVSKV